MINAEFPSDENLPSQQLSEDVDPYIVPGFTLYESRRLRNVRSDFLYGLRRKRLEFMRWMVEKGILKPGRD